MEQIVTTGRTFEEILEVVAKISEVDAADILSHSKKAEVVDARHIFVQLLVEHEWYPARIARKLGVTEGTVSRALDHLQDRCKFSGKHLKNILHAARERLK